MLGGYKQNLVHIRRPHRDCVRLAFERLSDSCGGMGQQWPASGAGALGAAILVVASGFFEEFTINPTMQFPSR